MTAGGRRDRLIKKSPLACLFPSVKLLKSQISIAVHSHIFYKLLITHACKNKYTKTATSKVSNLFKGYLSQYNNQP